MFIDKITVYTCWLYIVILWNFFFFFFDKIKNESEENSYIGLHFNDLIYSVKIQKYYITILTTIWVLKHSLTFVKGYSNIWEFTTKNYYRIINEVIKS